MSKALISLGAVFFAIGLMLIAVPVALAQTPTPAISPQTQTCLGCHSLYTPGIVADWQKSRHAQKTPGDALKVSAHERRISSETVPDNLKTYAVGCYECHSLNASAHKDNFAHGGSQINVVVSPNDCKVCHATEVAQYLPSKKANAHGNLEKNAVYSTLVDTVLGGKQIKDGKLLNVQASDPARMDTCYACHGTVVTVNGMKKVATKMGEQEFPDLTNWPNQGVGRINPDGSMGACTACHPRHSFSIEIARKPYTCGQCHLEPDVPAWDVYKESKHGNIILSRSDAMTWDAVPWTVGKDIQAPTCATCHSSLLTNPQGQVIAERTHDFGSRLWVRIFGLVYSAPQPKSGDTSIIKNKDGLPLPTAFTGELASDYLIDQKEQTARQSVMMGVCTACHSTDWTNKHFAKMDASVAEADKMVAAATGLMSQVWASKLAANANPFDEAIEQKWIKQWLFSANALRYASAMPGAPDYAAFHYGWWDLNNNLQEMQDWIDLKGKK